MRQYCLHYVENVFFPIHKALTLTAFYFLSIFNFYATLKSSFIPFLPLALDAASSISVSATYKLLNYAKIKLLHMLRLRVPSHLNLKVNDTDFNSSKISSYIRLDKFYLSHDFERPPTSGRLQLISDKIT
uniref:Uncharacterized protein n=1 Tax=Glossina brevipalpis TaxID=37001 RepID=A0A1A9WPU5_9MUSC